MFLAGGQRAQADTAAPGVGRHAAAKPPRLGRSPNEWQRRWSARLGRLREPSGSPILGCFLHSGWAGQERGTRVPTLPRWRRVVQAPHNRRFEAANGRQQRTCPAALECLRCRRCPRAAQPGTETSDDQPSSDVREERGGLRLRLSMSAPALIHRGRQSHQRRAACCTNKSCPRFRQPGRQKAAAARARGSVGCRAQSSRTVGEPACRRSGTGASLNRGRRRFAGRSGPNQQHGGNVCIAGKCPAGTC